MKFSNLHINWTAGKNLAFLDTLSQNTPPELLKREQKYKYHKTLSFFLQKTKHHHD